MMVVVVMGVAGSGKSTIAPLIAKGLGGNYAEGDRFHPPANIAKMSGNKSTTFTFYPPGAEFMNEALSPPSIVCEGGTSTPAGKGWRIWHPAVSQPMPVAARSMAQSAHF